MNETSWSYRQLDERANQIARALREKGARPNQVAAVMLRRSKETVAALLGIWKSGSAYMPLDPNHPPERLSFLLHDSQSSLLVTEQELLPFVPADYKGRLSQSKKQLFNQQLLFPYNRAADIGLTSFIHQGQQGGRKVCSSAMKAFPIHCNGDGKNTA